MVNTNIQNIINRETILFPHPSSYMILMVDSDAAYLVVLQARSASGYHFLGSKDNTMFNGAFYVLARVIKNCNGKCYGSRISSTLRERTESHHIPTYINQHGTSPTTYSYLHRQPNRRWHRYRNNARKTIEGHQYALPLAQREKQY